ncbi:InlB B-repeat-containing protein, partial [Candidatus Saccharibacteria bacterium]|nr:InlB B-repeat-containing protein [Candidatus Saccharibacteria bacterium]
YTATVNSSCLFYTVSFDKNAVDATGSMNSQSIPPSTATPLTTNAFERPGYVFLGWSTDQNATTPTYTDGQSVTDIAPGGGSVTLYAVWGRTMQDWATNFGCATLSTNQYLTLYDSRDKNSYVVKKLADNKCWMVQSLRLTNYNLTTADSDVSSDFSLTATTTYPEGANVWCSTEDATCNDKNQVYYNSAEPQNGAYYNWYTATAGTGTFALTSGNATSSICPKGWRLPTGGSSGDFALLDKAWGGTGTGRTDANTYSTFTGSYTSGNNANFDLAGAIIGTFNSVGTYGYSWSSSAYPSDSTRAYSTWLDIGTESVQPGVAYHHKFRGYPVRCIAQTSDATGFMQDTLASDLAEDQTTTLADKRDYQDYTVYRWPETGTAGANYPTGMAGYAIMTKDLSLGYITSGSVTKGDNLILATDDSAAAGTITARTSKNNWSSTNDDSNLQYINGPQSGKEAYSSHSYYSYGAAQKICPKGWRLPTKTEYDNIITFMGGSNSTSSSKIRSDPYNFVYGGLFYSGGWHPVGTLGYYWSSTQYNSSYEYRLLFDSSSLSTKTDDKNWGMSVRCVAETQNHYLQDASISDLPQNQTSILIDKRDNQEYTVYRWPSTGTAGTDYPTNMAGYAIMTKNLTLGGITGGSITANSNLILTTDDSAGNATILYRSTSSEWDNTNTESSSSLQYAHGANGSLENGSFYSFYAAKIVCPKGWRLPTATEYRNNIVSLVGGTGSAGSQNIRNSPYNFILAGYQFGANAGSVGYYWTSDLYNTSGWGYELYITSTQLWQPNYAGGTSSGFSVRCISAP